MIYDFDYYIKLNHFYFLFNLIQKNLIGKLIKKGKKFFALNLYYSIKYLLKIKTNNNPNLLILIGILNSLIKIKFITKRFGGSKKEIPIPIYYDRQIKFTITALLNFVKTKYNKSIYVKKLVNIICFSYMYKGPLIKKNFILLKKALENRVFLNFIKR